MEKSKTNVKAEIIIKMFKELTNLHKDNLKIRKSWKTKSRKQKLIKKNVSAMCKITNTLCSFNNCF